LSHFKSRKPSAGPSAATGSPRALRRLDQAAAMIDHQPHPHLCRRGDQELRGSASIRQPFMSMRRPQKRSHFGAL